MSDQPEDPWGHWRKPAEKPATTEATAGPRGDAEKEAKKPEEPAEKPLAGRTLGVNKDAVKPVPAKSFDRARPARPGNAGDRQERRPYAGKPAGKPAGTGGKPGAPGRDRDRPAPSAAGKPFRKNEGEAPRRPPRERQERSERPAGTENPWKSWSAREEKPEPVKKIVPSTPSTLGPAVASVVAGFSPRPAGEAPSGVRLSKVMSERGMCSRREADLWIERGWVFVDGECVSELGSRIDPQAKIEISKEAEKDQAKQVTILLHKPVGYVSGQPEPDCVPAVTLVTAENQLVQSGDPEFKPWMLRGLAPAGRLDVDSTGLLVLTSDGRVAKRLIGEDSDAEKEYLVRVSGEMVKDGLDLLRHGLELDGKPLKPAWVKQLNEDQLHFILTEGKKRQIRRMCELVGLRVIGLKRVRIGRIRLGDLPMGQWRFLRADEKF
jgi:23S rRNA pseudouridine2604 synthase